MKELCHIFFGIFFAYIAFLFTSDCHSHSETRFVETTKYEYRDTIISETLYVKIPKPFIRKVFKTDTLWKLWVRDSFCTDTVQSEISFNEYWDSVRQGDLRLDYKITTFGELVQFEPVLHYYGRDNTITITKTPKWMFGTGIWTNGKSIRPSVNIYHKGFGVGFNNGINLTKQWILQ